VNECAPSRAGAGTARRVAISLAFGLTIAGSSIVLGAGPAAAHTASGPRPTNYLTSLGAISPRIPGVTVSIVDLGNKIQVTNRTAIDLVVLGYLGEPYLRVGPKGVYANLRSPATYQNRSRTITTDVPLIARGTGPLTPPEWHRVSGSRTATWHDHRIHYMGTSPPLAVQRHPGAVYTIVPQWTIVFRYAAQTVEVHGRLSWVPGPGGWPWLVMAFALLAVGAAIARSRRRSFTVAAIVLLVGVDLVHTISAELARSGSHLAKIIQFFGDDFVSVIVWVVAAATIWGLMRRRVEALYGTLLVGAMVGLVSGLTDLSYLWKSQLPTVGPDAIARAEVATAFGLGLGLAVGALLALRASAPARPASGTLDSRWIERLVAGLDHDQVALECGRLDAGEVVPAALADAADRLAPVAEQLGSEALVFVVLAQDQIGTHVWSITAAAAGTPGLRVQRGRPAPVRTEVRVTFPAFLCLLGGRLGVDEAIAAGRLDVDGDRAFLATVEPRLASAVSV
jgi:hypothetical protein